MTPTTSAAPVIDDDRKKSTSRFHDLMIRPEFGAVIAAIAMFAFFAFIAPVILQPSSISTVLYGASTIGIMAVGVSLLMIGGEFDLSTGVAVISSGITASMFTWFFVTNVWVGVAVALVFSLGIGFINGVIFIKTRLPSFIVTLAMFLMLAGLNLALTDRKSTRLNSSHVAISYAVFCLKK